MNFYLMMTIVVGAFFLNVPFLAIIALPIFLISLMGVEISFKGTGRAMPTFTKFNEYQSAA